MGTPVPAVLTAGPTVFTAVDHDEDLTPERVEEVRCIDDSAIMADLATIESCRAQTEAGRAQRRRRMASAALTFMDRARVNLLDADFDPWSVGTPAHQGGLKDHRAIEPSALQMVFGTTIANVRERLKERKTRPLPVFEIPQTSSVPSDAILLNLLFYLSTDGYLVSPKVTRQEDGTYIVSVVVD